MIDRIRTAFLTLLRERGAVAARSLARAEGDAVLTIVPFSEDQVAQEREVKRLSISDADAISTADRSQRTILTGPGS